MIAEFGESVIDYATYVDHRDDEDLASATVHVVREAFHCPDDQIIAHLIERLHRKTGVVESPDADMWYAEIYRNGWTTLWIDTIDREMVRITVMIPR
jgi:hypothetical protein